jgi:hypothetical protein
VNGSTDSEIDQFRLHNQQTFQLTFDDLSRDLNYRLFIILMEGVIFSSSQTVVSIRSKILLQLNIH